MQVLQDSERVCSHQVSVRCTDDEGVVRFSNVICFFSAFMGLNLNYVIKSGKKVKNSVEGEDRS